MELHQRLKDAAVRGHRSMTKQVLAILEGALGAPPEPHAVTPVKGTFQLTDAWLIEAKGKGRP
jgi:hypothetical protein